jgi:tRNA(Ile)-lysidine synthase
VQAHALLAAGDRILVAVSGGPDSVGLLAVLHHLKRRYGISLVAAHVNHGLRGEDAARDERCAEEVAARLEVPFVRDDVARELRAGPNLEERARQVRYRALHRLAASNRCAKIATGHTRDDQAETVIMRLVRGAGPGGLVAIRPRRDDGVIRPLLECRRADVEAAVRAAGLPFRHDRMNDDPRFLRTQVRRRVLPLLAELNPRVVDALARTAELEWSSRRMVDAFLARTLGSAGADRLDVELLERVGAEWRGHVLRHWLAGPDGRGRNLGARHVDAVLRLLERGDGSKVVELPGGRRVRRRGGWLVLGDARGKGRDGGAEVCATEVLAPGRDVRTSSGWWLSARWEGIETKPSLPADLWSAVCDAESVAVPLTVRAPRRGERVRPLGLRGTRKLSDAFIDRKIPAEDRSAYPVVDDRGEVLWVPGVVRGEGARIGPLTRRILRLSARRRD